MGAEVDSKVECIHVGARRIGYRVVMGVCARSGVRLSVPVVFIAGSHMVGCVVVLGN